MGLGHGPARRDRPAARRRDLHAGNAQRVDHRVGRRRTWAWSICRWAIPPSTIGAATAPRRRTPTRPPSWRWTSRPASVAWHYQTVHYDVWDYDLGGQGTLVDFPTPNGPVPAIVMPSKQAQFYILNRATGEPLVTIEERPAPQGGVEPDRLSPTQPYVTDFPNLLKPDLTEADMWGTTPLDQLWCRIQFRQASYDGVYTPPTVDRPWIQFPGYNGGSDWGGVAIDPVKGIMIANYNNMPNYNQLVPRDEVDEMGVVPITDPNYDSSRRRRLAWQHLARRRRRPTASGSMPAGACRFTGLLCKQPPYGGIAAIDLNDPRGPVGSPLRLGAQERTFRHSVDAAGRDRHAQQWRRRDHRLGPVLHRRRHRRHPARHRHRDRRGGLAGDAAGWRPGHAHDLRGRRPPDRRDQCRRPRLHGNPDRRLLHRLRPAGGCRIVSGPFLNDLRRSFLLSGARRAGEATHDVRGQWLLTLFARRLWLRVSLMALVGVATAAAGIVLAPYVPDAWTIRIGAQAIDGILNVLASSMLAVTVFSVSTMVAAYGAATNNVTPRATKLLMEDNTSQNVLGTFIGAFLFSLVGIIALSHRPLRLAGARHPARRHGRAHRADCRHHPALDRLSVALRPARRNHPARRGGDVEGHEDAARPPLSRRPGRCCGSMPSATWPVHARDIGYVQHIDIAALDDCARLAGREVFVTALPGVFADPRAPSPWCRARRTRTSERRWRGPS